MTFGLNCFNVTVSRVAGLGERNDQSQAGLQSYIFEKWKNFQKSQKWPFLETVYLHALHVHFLSFDILKTFSIYLRCEMQLCGRREHMMTNVQFLSSYVSSAGSNLISG